MYNISCISTIYVCITFRKFPKFAVQYFQCHIKNVIAINILCTISAHSQNVLFYDFVPNFPNMFGSYGKSPAGRLCCVFGIPMLNNVVNLGSEAPSQICILAELTTLSPRNIGNRKLS